MLSCRYSRCLYRVLDNAVLANAALTSVPGFSYAHQSLIRSFVDRGAPQAPSPHVTENRMQDLVEAIVICAAATTDRNRKARDAAYGRFGKYLNAMAAEPRTASPAHCIAYLHAYSRRGTYKLGTLTKCSPDSMHNQIGFLRKALEMYDQRVGPYCPITRQGNPFNSVEVMDFSTGYTKTMRRGGYRPRSAAPWQKEDYLAVLTHIQSELQEAEGLKRVLLARDAFAMSIGWSLFTRGKTVLDWHLHELATEAGSGEVPVGTRVICSPVSLKADLSPEPFMLVMADDCTNALWLLQQYWQVAKAEGAPLTDVLFRPLAPNQGAFLEKMVDTSTYHARLKIHFAAVGVPYPATPHGCRRGAYQAAVQEGATIDEVGELARIVTPKVRAIYADRHRHQPCRLKRVKRTMLDI
eukprot:jgi/Botrbrau1/8536/Bobra.0359s0001.1